jgi:hypothetical protein
MAEVAEDRNQKRQINIQQQQVNLQRQQEARIARDNAVQNQLESRRIALAEQSAPIAAMERMLNIKKSQAEIEDITRSLSNESSYVDRQNNIIRAATASNQGPVIPQVSQIQQRETRVTRETPREEEITPKQLQQLTTRTPSTTEAVTPPIIVEDTPQEKQTQRAIQTMAREIENRNISEAEEKKRNAQQEAKEREMELFSTRPKTSQSTGWGVKSNVGSMASMDFFDNDWGNFNTR